MHDGRGIIVEKLCEYLQYKYTYENVPPKEDIPDFLERIQPEIVLELCVLHPTLCLAGKTCVLIDVSHSITTAWPRRTTTKVSPFYKYLLRRGH